MAQGVGSYWSPQAEIDSNTSSTSTSGLRTTPPSTKRCCVDFKWQQRFVLGGVVRSPEVEVEDVLESISAWGDQYDPTPCAIQGERAVKVHLPMF
jgi:hypothetical protein